MGIVKTDIRTTRERAAQIRFYPASPIVATNVQEAIEVIAAGVVGASVLVTAAMSPYTPPARITDLLVDTTGGAVTIVLPLAAARDGLPVLIKDVTGNADVNNITINSTAPETVDTLSTIVLSNPFAFFRASPKTGGYFDET